MGKRSDFKRIDRDLYRTFDPKAGRALASVTGESKTYIEPFAGAGDLVDQLPEYLHCMRKSDIVPLREDIEQKDAFSYTKEDFKDIDWMITNSPWDRKIFHRAIEHFVPIVDCWFLIDANWIWTKQAQSYMNKYVTDVVPIGRMKWIPETKMSGKDDCVWLFMTKNKIHQCVLHPRVT